MSIAWNGHIRGNTEGKRESLFVCMCVGGGGGFESRCKHVYAFLCNSDCSANLLALPMQHLFCIVNLKFNYVDATRQGQLEVAGY